MTFLHQHFFQAPPSPVEIVCSRGWPIALSSETYFISQQENKDNGGGGDGAQYFIGLHFDEIASGCPAGELWPPRAKEQRLADGALETFSTHISLV